VIRDLTIRRFGSQGFEPKAGAMKNIGDVIK